MVRRMVAAQTAVATPVASIPVATGAVRRRVAQEAGDVQDQDSHRARVRVKVTSAVAAAAVAAPAPKASRGAEPLLIHQKKAATHQEGCLFLGS